MANPSKDKKKVISYSTEKIFIHNGGSRGLRGYKRRSFSDKQLIAYKKRRLEKKNNKRHGKCKKISDD